MRHIERIANVAIIVAVIAFLSVVVRKELFSRQLSGETAQSLVGRKINLPGVQFPNNKDSLVFVISTTCHFCRESLPFYKEFSEKSKGHLNMVWVLPQPEPEARKFLLDSGIQASRVISAAPNSLGVRGTPTAMLVDGGGKVIRVWPGKLDVAGQEELEQAALSRTAR
jgi:thioredoxin-related protein